MIIKTFVIACVNHIRKIVQHFENNLMMFCLWYRDNIIKDYVYKNYKLKRH